jgi:two-component system copper resistance phosphate regulon response regulator CusR
MLTAVDAVPRILKSFDLGADDYLVKPFIVEILLARVAAIARRGARPDPAVVSACGIRLDPTRRIAIRCGQEIPLTRKQFDLLEVLMTRAGQITSREQLIEAGWGHIAQVKDNTLDVYICGLRAKLEDPFEENRPIIQTVHGTGYLFGID